MAMEKVGTITEVVVGMLEFAETVNFRDKAPVPLLLGFVDHFTVVGGRALEELEEPIPHAKTGTIFVLIEIVGGCEDLTDEGLTVGGMLLGQGCHVAVRELFDPISGLIVAVGSRDREVWSAFIPVENIALWA